MTGLMSPPARGRGLKQLTYGLYSHGSGRTLKKDNLLAESSLFVLVFLRLDR